MYGWIKTSHRLMSEGSLSSSGSLGVMMCHEMQNLVQTVTYRECCGNITLRLRIWITIYGIVWLFSKRTLSDEQIDVVIKNTGSWSTCVARCATKERSPEKTNRKAFLSRTGPLGQICSWPVNVIFMSLDLGPGQIRSKAPLPLK